jgi:hypothetical protein
MSGFLSSGIVNATAIPDSVVDNFEDGDINISLKNNWSGWSGDTGSVTAQQSTVIEGSWSAEQSANGGTVKSVKATRDTSGTPTEVSSLFQVTNRNGVKSDQFQLFLKTGSQNTIAVNLKGNGEMFITNGPTSGSYNSNTPYIVRLYNIDWTNEQFDAEIKNYNDGTVVYSVSNNGFGAPASQADGIEIQIDANDGSSQTFVWDYVKWIQ